MQISKELTEQISVFDLANLMENRYPELELMYHVANEGKRSEIGGSLLKRAGMKKGVPDIVLPVSRHGYHGLYIELKADGGKVTKDQKKFLKGLAAEGYAAFSCWGYEAVVSVLCWYLDFTVQLMKEPKKIEKWSAAGAEEWREEK